MIRIALRPSIIGIAMLATAGLAVAMWPDERIADRAAKVDLERMVPLEFGDWTIDRTLVPIGVSPQAPATLDKIYNQTLARTYVNGAGQRVMLSIVYGADQRGAATQMHQPESCYTMQGFQLTGNSVGRLETAHGILPVTRLMAVQGPRKEPITYWITIGDRTALPGLDRKLAQLRYGLTGQVADGMLVRVSTIGSDTAQAYSVQDAFVRDLLGVVREQDRARLAGTIGARQAHRIRRRQVRRCVP